MAAQEEEEVMEEVVEEKEEGVVEEVEEEVEEEVGLLVLVDIEFEGEVWDLDLDLVNMKF